jgi:hypothetical protein
MTFSRDWVPRAFALSMTAWTSARFKGASGFSGS